MEFKEETKLVLLLAVSIFTTDLATHLFTGYSNHEHVFSSIPHLLLFSSILVIIISPLLLIPKKRVEEAKNKLKRILDEIGDGILVIDNEYNIIMANSHIGSIFNKISNNEPIKIKGKKCYDIIPNEFCKTDLCCLKRINKGEIVLEQESKINGKWIQNITTPFKDSNGNIQGMIKTLRDISPKKESEEKVKRLYNILKAIKEINQIITKESEIKTIYSRSCEILKDVRSYFHVAIVSLEGGQIAKLSECGKKKFLKLDKGVPLCLKKASESKKPVIFEDAKRFCENCPSYLNGVRYSSAIIPLISSNSDYSTFLAVFADVNHFDKEEIELLIGVSGDISFAVDKYLAEDSLKKSEEKYRTTFEHTGTAMAIIEGEVISAVNSKFQELTGYKTEELIGKYWTDLVHPEDADRMASYHFARINGGIAPKNYEFRLLDCEDNTKEVFLTIDLIPGTNTSVASHIDITYLKRLNRLLKVLSEINELVAKEKKPEVLLRAVCEKLVLVYDAVFTALGENEPRPIMSRGIDISSIIRAIKKCPSVQKAIEGETTKLRMDDNTCRHCTITPHKYVLSIPLIHNMRHGIITIHSSLDFSKEEINLLKKLSSNIAFALYSYEVERDKKLALEQLSINLAQFEHSADRLRNPVAVILSSLELKDELDNNEILEIIDEQTKKIIKELDVMRHEEIKTYMLSQKSQ